MQQLDGEKLETEEKLFNKVASEDGLLQAMEDAGDFIIRLEIEIEKAEELLKSDKKNSSHRTEFMILKKVYDSVANAFMKAKQQMRQDKWNLQEFRKLMNIEINSAQATRRLKHLEVTTKAEPERKDTSLSKFDSNKAGKANKCPVEHICGLEEPDKLEENDQIRTRADPNLAEEEPEVVTIGLETNKEEISEIPNNIKRGLWWTAL
uniref:ING domain-containing protein n=1 Tax=Syphacia muris TaxID=451379 RepID=A0A0N5AZU6_9BILA